MSQQARIKLGLGLIMLGGGVNIALNIVLRDWPWVAGVAVISVAGIIFSARAISGGGAPPEGRP